MRENKVKNLTDEHRAAAAEALLAPKRNEADARSENRRIAELMANRNSPVTPEGGAIVGGIAGFLIWRSFWPTFYMAFAGLVAGAVLALAIGYLKHRRIARNDGAT